MVTIRKIKEAVVNGDVELTLGLIDKALQNGINPQFVVIQALGKGIEKIGERFENGRAYVPDLLLSVLAAKAALQALRPYMKEDAADRAGTVIIGTVRGDLHDMGKNIVAAMLEGGGFEVVNLGVDIPIYKFIEAVKEYKADVLCLSALLTTTMTYMKDILDELEKAGIRKNVKVIVGGAPLSDDFARKIGADGFSPSAGEVVQVVRKLLGKE